MTLRCKRCGAPSPDRRLWCFYERARDCKVIRAVDDDAVRDAALDLADVAEELREVALTRAVERLLAALRLTGETR